MSNTNVAWDTVGEMTWRDKEERKVRQSRAKSPMGKKHGAHRPCANPLKCLHAVNVHFEVDEDPARACSIPDCPCTGYVAPAIAAPAS